MIRFRLRLGIYYHENDYHVLTYTYVYSITLALNYDNTHVFHKVWNTLNYNNTQYFIRFGIH